MQALKCDDKDEMEAITETLIGDPNKDQCDYECQSTGGCNVRYTGPPRGGPTSGSCFPPLFGGSCSGTPPECLDCNKALDCTESTTELTESKNSSEVTNTDGEDSNGPLNGDEVVIGQILFKIDKSFSHKKRYKYKFTSPRRTLAHYLDKVCDYRCQESGGCEVQYTGSIHLIDQKLSLQMLSRASKRW